MEGKNARRSAFDREKEGYWEDKPPLVSICCLAFNHEAYIREALEGFLMQKTDFPIEILIHDDASTDGTASVIKEYEKRFPQVVKPVYQTENQYSKGIKNISGIFNFPRAAGKYIAMCEGDDYWTDPDKLQKQVDFLEQNPGCSLCFHSAKIVTVGRTVTDARMRPYRKERRVSAEDIIDKPSGYAMCSMVFPARIMKKLPDYYLDCPIGDIPMQLMMAAEGWGYYFDEDMGAYRVGVSGSWTNAMKEGDYQGKQERYCRQMRQMYEAFDRETKGRFHEAAMHAAARLEYLTKVNTKQYDIVLAPENREFYREMNFRTRFFIRFEVTAPRLYRLLQRAVTGKN